MIEAIFIVPVAGKDAERAAYAVRSIRAHCEHFRIYLLLDGVEPLALAPELDGPDIRLRSSNPPSRGHWGKIWLMQARAMVEANQENDLAPDAVFIRMDSDALIIREGLVARARRIFSTRPVAGQIGQVFSTVRGARFSNRGWTNHMHRIMGWRGLWLLLRSAVWNGEGPAAGLRAFRDFRAIVNGAFANGYVYGDICPNGLTVIRREVVAKMAQTVRLDTLPFRFPIIKGDDVIMTLMTYLMGYAPIDDSSDDGICAIESAPLRVDPFVLKRRGHYVIHPLKYGHKAHGHDLSEAELVRALLDS